MYFNKKIKYFFFGFGILIIHQIFFQNFILNKNLLGHDYEYFLPTLTYGKMWFQNNSFQIPWFTPSICCGTVYYADSQTMHFSFQQLLFNFLSVNIFFKFLFFLLSFFSFVGFYKLLRVFTFSRLISLFGGFIFLFSNFYINKFLAGHLTHTNFALLPIFSYFFIKSQYKKNFFNKYTILTILIFANFIYSGSGSFLPIMLFSFFMIIFLYVLKKGLLNKVFLIKFFIIFLFGIFLSLSKINAVLSVMKNFPRIYDHIYFDNIYSLIRSNLFSFSGFDDVVFFNEKLASSPLLKVFNHELNFSLGFLFILLLIFQINKIIKVLFNKKKYFLLFIPIIFPFILNLNLPYISNFFRSLPVLESLYFNYRWFVAFAPLFIIAGCFIIQQQSKKYHSYLMLVFFAATLSQTFFNKEKFLSISQSYNATELIKFNENLQNKPIGAVLAFTSEDPKFNKIIQYQNIPLQRNNYFIQGFSNLICYQPIYGYNLEKMDFNKITFSQSKKIKENFYAITGGFDNLGDETKYNMFNPICLLFPEENNCLPWDLFEKKDEYLFKEFINNRPIHFKISKAQKISNYISLGTLILLLTIVIIQILFYFKKKIKKL